MATKAAQRLCSRAKIKLDPASIQARKELPEFAPVAWAEVVLDATSSDRVVWIIGD